MGLDGTYLLWYHSLASVSTCCQHSPEESERSLIDGPTECNQSANPSAPSMVGEGNLTSSVTPGLTTSGDALVVEPEPAFEAAKPATTPCNWIIPDNIASIGLVPPGNALLGSLGGLGALGSTEGPKPDPNPWLTSSDCWPPWAEAAPCCGWPALVATEGAIGDGPKPQLRVGSWLAVAGKAGVGTP